MRNLLLLLLFFSSASSPSSGHRSYFMRTETSRAAPMSVTLTVLTCTPTSAAATPLRWRVAAGCCMRSPTTLATSTFWREENTLTTSAGWGTMTPSAPAVLSLMWVNPYVNVVTHFYFISLRTVCSDNDYLCTSTEREDSFTNFNKTIISHDNPTCNRLTQHNMEQKK